MRVVLIETTSREYRENPLKQMDRILEPLAIEYIGAHLQACGHDVELIQQLTAGTEEVLHKIVLSRPDVVGFSCMTYSFPETLSLAKLIKRELPDVKTVLGGYHVLGMETAPDCFDFIIKGEGEISSEKVLDFLEGKIDLQLIPGLQFYRGLRWDIPSKRSDLACLENPIRLPREAFHSMSMGENLPDTRIACVVAGRGCPYRCDFCCTPQLYPGQRILRPVEEVVSEIIKLRDEMGVNSINLRDETFTPNKEYVESFCKEMISRKANVSWRAFANVGNLSENLIQLMAEAKCHMLFYGIEASDSDTLKKRRKNFRREEQIAEDIRMTQKAGIYVRAGFIVGHESDTRKTFERHGEFLRQVCPDELHISFLTPFPGTPLYQEVRKAGKLLTEDFSLYDCEHPVLDIGISTEELLTLRNELYVNFYSSMEWVRHITDRAKRNSTEREEIERFAAFTSKKRKIKNPFCKETTRTNNGTRNAQESF